VNQSFRLQFLTSMGVIDRPGDEILKDLSYFWVDVGL
jgi:hypothetical protein